MKSCALFARLKQFIILYVGSKVTQRWKTSYGSNVSLNAARKACCFLLFGSNLLKQLFTEENRVSRPALLDFV